MRISTVTSSYPRYSGDGIAHFVKSISENLVNLSVELEVIAPYDELVDSNADANIDGLTIQRVRYIWKDKWHIMGHGRSLFADVKLRGGVFLLLPLYLLVCGWRLLRSVRRQQSDVIHAHWALPGGLIAAVVSVITRVPFVVSLHGSDMFVAQSNRVFQGVARWVFARASGVTACSPELRDAALSLGANPATTHLVPYGVDPTVFHPDSDREAARQRLQIDTSSQLIISLGRMVHKKGFTFLIDAWPQVLSKHPSAMLMIGGEGPLKETLAEQAAARKVAASIIFPGNMERDGVNDMFAAADVFVLPSVRDSSGNLDGLPNVLMEAMSSGKAIVASDIGGVPVVIDDGKNGFIVPPAQSERLATKITALLSDAQLRTDYGKQARQDILDKHTWSHVARQYLDILEFAVSAEKSNDAI